MYLFLERLLVQRIELGVLIFENFRVDVTTSFTMGFFWTPFLGAYLMPHFWSIFLRFLLRRGKDTANGAGQGPMLLLSLISVIAH